MSLENAFREHERHRHHHYRQPNLRWDNTLTFACCCLSMCRFPETKAATHTLNKNCPQRCFIGRQSNNIWPASLDRGWSKYVRTKNINNCKEKDEECRHGMCKTPAPSPLQRERFFAVGGTSSVPLDHDFSSLWPRFELHFAFKACLDSRCSATDITEASHYRR